MSEYKEKIYNVTTGEEIIKDYTPEQLIAVEEAQVRDAKNADNIRIKEAARQAVLEKLGLTADEAAALLG
jgi:hypothetical protein